MIIFLSVACLASTEARVRELQTSKGEPVIDSVEIIAENVFDQSDKRYDNFLFRIANKTHFVTRGSVIKRELLLGKGDVFDTALVNESIRNLRQLPYLLKTDIYLKKGQNHENIMIVNTSDKWTTVGGLSFHRVGGRTDIQIGVEENNLLGYGIFLSNYYWVVENDRDFYQLELADSRFLGNNVAFNLFFSDNTRAGQTTILMGRPYYSLSQKWGGEIRFTSLKRRLDYYVSERLAARDRCRRNTYHAQLSYRIGPNHLKYHFTARYQYIDLDSLGMVIYDPASSSQLPRPIEDSVFHYCQYTFRIQQINYAVFERLNRFYKSEDINRGLDARISYGRACEPEFDGTFYHYFQFWPQYTMADRSNLLVLGLQHWNWYTRDYQIRRRLNCYLRAYKRYHHNNTLAIGISFLSNRLSDQSFTLYLDEDNGLRGYPAFLLNGENRLTINIENRFFSDLEILSVGIGGVVFADIGNIWARSGDPTLAQTQTSFGAGLRFGISRSTKGEVLRLDLAYAPKLARWRISFGTGQFF